MKSRYSTMKCNNLSPSQQQIYHLLLPSHPHDIISSSGPLQLNLFSFFFNTYTQLSKLLYFSYSSTHLFTYLENYAVMSSSISSCCWGSPAIPPYTKSCYSSASVILLPDYHSFYQSSSL